MSQQRIPSSARSTLVAKVKAPPHPCPELQGPFEESMIELAALEEDEIPSDAAGRRTILLDAPTYERVIAGRWKQRPGEKYHPLWKIIAQLSFGIHLLAENLAKSEEEVMHILQGHIDEIDLFLERTTEDFVLAKDDISERMRCLQLPLQHPKVFDRMLEDRAFRNSIVEGNEKIEHIVSRTGCAMKDSLKDAQKGLDATNALGQYLASLANTWGIQNPSHEAVFEAMLENVEGWRSAFIDLHTQGEKLGKLLKQLSEVINQMQQRAGEISRRLVQAQKKLGHSPASSKKITYISRPSISSFGDSEVSDLSPRKTLPGVPHRERARPSTTQSQRPSTAQSARSGVSQLSANAYPSRASSREGSHPPGQSKSGLRSPRIVEIQRQSPLGEVPQPSPKALVEIPEGRVSVGYSSASRVDASKRVHQTSPNAKASGGTAGLGIIRDATESQSAGQLHSPTPNSKDPTKEAFNMTRLPLTPSSMNSNGDTNEPATYELSTKMTPRHISIPSMSTSKQVDSAIGSPPSTPSWAKRQFDTGERNRMVMSKTAFRSHPPNTDLGSPPIIYSNTFNANIHHDRINQSLSSSIGAPGPEVPSSETSNSVRSGSLKISDIKDEQSVGLIPVITDPTGDGISGQQKGKKVFVAELEGSTPSARQLNESKQEMLRDVPRTVGQEPVELEAPQQYWPVRPALPERTMTDSSLISKLSTTSGPDSVLLSRNSPVSFSTTSQVDTNGMEHKVAAAVRRSFIATNIELPGTPLTTLQAASSTLPAPKRESKVVRKSVTSMQDIIAQLDQLSNTTPDLSLKGEEMLTTLPATIYETEYSPVAVTPSAQMSRKKSNEVPTTLRTGSGTPRTKPELLQRMSSESTSSGQSQWRAFFKGQLSPATFHASTPHLPAKTSRTVIELRRHEQETSPTIGWQWAPETPDVDTLSSKAINVQQ